MPTTETKTPPPSIDNIVHWDAHEKEKAEWQAKYKAMKPELRRCLDAEYAGQKESQKPTFEYEIKCTINERKGGRMTGVVHTGTVTAQNENDAWARFCDSMQKWPSRNDSDAEIKKVK